MSSIGLLLGSRDSAGALVGAEGEILARVSVPNAYGPQDGLQGLQAMVSRLVTKAERGGGGPVTGIGVGFPGVVKDGVVRGTRVTWRSWLGYDLGGALGAATSLPVSIRNDVTCVLIGELAVGAAQGARNAVVAYSSHGVGGGLLIEGEVLTGAAGHLGHLPVAAAAGMPCSCGGMGHVDSVASASGMTRLYRERRGLSAADVPHFGVVREAARSGEEIAVASLQVGGRALGSVLGGIVNLLAPELIVLAGESATEPIFATELAAAMAGELIPGADTPELRHAQLGGDAQLIGAALLAQ